MSLILEDDHMWTVDDGGKVPFEGEAYFPKEYDSVGLEMGIGVAVVVAAVGSPDLQHRKERGHSEEDYEVEVCVSLQPSITSYASP